MCGGSPSEIPCLVIELPVLTVTSRTNSANNGEAAYRSAHEQGVREEDTAIPWEAPPVTGYW